MALLELQRVTKNFGGLCAINNVNMAIEKGEIRGLIGPNGAGKTTLFNLITGFLRLDKGSVVFNGEDISNLRPDQICKKGIARTFQLGKHFSRMTVFENVLVGAYCRTNDELTAKKESEKVLRFLNLYDKRNIETEELTPAERKITELGRALATSPSLLLLDEIMAGLNAVEIETMKRIILDLHKMGLTIVIVEHLMDAIMSISNKISVLSYGKLLAEGTPKEICNNEDVIKAYLGEKWAGK